MGAFLLPFKAVPKHGSGELLLFGQHPLIPLRRSTGTATKALCGESLFQRYPCIQSSLAPGSEGDEINVDMGRGLVHVQVSGEDVKVEVPFPEALEVFIQRCLGLFSNLRCIFIC